MSWPPAVQELVGRAMDDRLARAADAVRWGQAPIVDAEAAAGRARAAPIGPGWPRSSLSER